jgi:hypothetical protein
LKVQGQKSTALVPRKPKSTQNSRSSDFNTHPNQESSLQTAADQELKTSSCRGTTAVTGKTSVKGVSYSSPSVHCHRNATGLVVSHGPISRVGSAVQNQHKSVPAVGETSSRSTEVNSSSHTAVPFMQPKKQHSMSIQEVSYGMYFTSRKLLILSHLHGNVLLIMYRKFTICFQYTGLLSIVFRKTYETIEPDVVTEFYIFKAVLMLELLQFISLNTSHSRYRESYL